MPIRSTRHESSSEHASASRTGDTLFREYKRLILDGLERVGEDLRIVDAKLREIEIQHHGLKLTGAEWRTHVDRSLDDVKDELMRVARMAGAAEELVKQIGATIEAADKAERAAERKRDRELLYASAGGGGVIAAIVEIVRRLLS